jgi:hypothetical protein
MKARWILFRALLLVLVVSPTAMWALPRTLSLPSCQTPKHQIRTSYDGHGHRTTHQLVASLPGHHGPATRLHRKRGKKISISRGFVIAQGSSATSRYRFSKVSVCMWDQDNPNPSRGPPALSL